MSKVSKLMAVVAIAGSMALPFAALAAKFAPASAMSHMSSIKKTTMSTAATTVTGTVSSISGTSISLQGSNSTAYTVDASNAKIMRKFGATMQVSDMQTGDSLTVRGTVSGSNVTATTIRDNSQQQKNGTFAGSVQSVNGASFVVQTSARGTETINPTSTTVYKESGLTSVSLSNITVGENVRVAGLWDSTNTNVTANTVTIVVKTGSVVGIFQSASGTSLTMTAKNASSTVYTVDGSSAKLIRHYGAAMQVTDMQAGDQLTVSGTINGMNVTAKTVRDDSLQAHNGTFVGSITAVNGSSFTLQSKARGNQTINTASTTVFKLGTQTGSLSDVAVGQTATVSGVWDRTNANVTATRVTVKVSTMAVNGIFQSLSGTTFTMQASSTTYSVDASKAKVAYKGGRAGSLAILQPNDQVTVRGQSVSGSTSITASTVRDLSQTYTKPAPTPTPTPTTAQ